MTVFLNDTVARQIEDGEIWTQSLQFNVPAGSSVYMTVHTDANPVNSNIEVYAPAKTSLVITEGVTESVAGVAVSLINMNRSGSFSTNVVLKGSGTYTGGTIIHRADIPNDYIGAISKSSGELGFVLKENLITLYQIKNQSNNEYDINVNLFLREI